MIFIWGFKRYIATLGIVTLACRNGHTAAHRIIRVTRKFTLFFIPLFPVGKQYYSTCTMCGLQVKWTKEEAEAMTAHAGNPSAGATFDPVSPPVNPYQVPAAAIPVQTPAAPTPSAGWYPDPSGQAQQRWWDGRGWTEMVQPFAPGPAPGNTPPY